MKRSPVGHEDAVRSSRVRPSSLPPWTLGEQLSLAFTTLVGAAGLLIAWLQISDEPNWTSQIRWLTASVGAVIVAGVGCGIWLFEGLRHLRERKREVFARLTPALRGTLKFGEATAGSLDRCTAARMTTYHRPGCLLVAGKALVWQPAPQHEREGRRPCGACAP